MLCAFPGTWDGVPETPCLWTQPVYLHGFLTMLLLQLLQAMPTLPVAKTLGRHQETESLGGSSGGNLPHSPRDRAGSTLPLPPAQGRCQCPLPRDQRRPRQGGQGRSVTEHCPRRPWRSPNFCWQQIHTRSGSSPGNERSHS